MSKKLNIIEAMKMPIGTEFTMRRNDSDMPSNVYIDSDTCFRWKHNDEPFSPYVDNLIATFIPIQKPVSFIDAINEAINNKKRISCIHDRFVSSGEYMNISKMFTCMGQGAEDFPMDLISNGRWYIEESEDNSNE